MPSNISKKMQFFFTLILNKVEKFNVVLGLIMVLLCLNNFLFTSNLEDFIGLSFPIFLIYTKTKFAYLFELSNRYSVFIQSNYDKISFWLLNSKFKFLLLLWYRFLFYYRSCCCRIYLYIGEQHFLALSIILSIILSKYYLNSLLFFFFFVVKLEFATLRMAKFYKNNPILFNSHFNFQEKRHDKKSKKLKKVQEILRRTKIQKGPKKLYKIHDKKKHSRKQNDTIYR